MFHSGVSHSSLVSRIFIISLPQVTDFTDKVNFYIMNAVTFFKSMWSQVKANAALLVGENCVRSCAIYTQAALHTSIFTLAALHMSIFTALAGIVAVSTQGTCWAISHSRNLALYLKNMCVKVRHVCSVNASVLACSKQNTTCLFIDCGGAIYMYMYGLCTFNSQQL